MSLLTLIQNTANSVGLTAPSVVVTSTDANVVTLLALANSSGKEMAKAYEWQEMMQDSGTIVSSGTILQGTLTTVFGASFDRIVNQTFWDGSSRLPIDGPITIQQWQQFRASNVVGPPYIFIIQNNQLWIGPTPIDAGHALSCYFMSKYWCQSSGGTGQTAWTADDDTAIIPEELLLLDLIWRYKQKKGLAYAEDMKTAQRQFETYTAQNKANRILFLGGRNILYPANIPEGYWPG